MRAGERWEMSWKGKWAHNMKDPVARPMFLKLFSEEKGESPNAF